MTIDTKTPVKLSPARAWRTYLGGTMIDQIHGITDTADDHFPEEWIISTTAARNVGREQYPDEGMNFLSDSDCSLKEFINSHPSELLGAAHCSRYGAQTGVLIKVIDSAERLSIQVHPDRPTAKKLFQSDYGKTECWHILGGREINGEKPCIYFGFKPGITREKWKEIFDTQDIPAMLDCLHKFEISPGDTFLIEGGIPHAIGSGCFLLEIQEPTDYTIRTEITTPSGFRIAEFMCHQGLGFDRMFDCFDYTGYTYEETYERWHISPKVLTDTQSCIQKEIIGYSNTPMFRMISITVSDTAVFESDNIFSGLYILSGKGVLCTSSGVQTIEQGDQYFIPASSESFSLKNTETLPIIAVRCYGPEPSAR